MFLWNPSESKTAIARLTGHQQLVNQVRSVVSFLLSKHIKYHMVKVMFSPDTRYIASASFDKSVKLWCGRTGKFIASLRLGCFIDDLVFLLLAFSFLCVCLEVT